MRANDHAGDRTCAQCHHSLQGARYSFGHGRDTRCFGCALRQGSMLRKALTVALVVGTILSLINQGDRLLAGDLGAISLPKILLTYAVPFCVSVYSALATSRERRAGTKPHE